MNLQNGRKSPRRYVLDWLVYLVARVFICIVQALRVETCRELARVLSVVLYDIVSVRRRVIDENLRHAYPHLSSRHRSHFARGMWEHLILMLGEIALAQRKIHRSNWKDHIEWHQKKQLVDLLLDSRSTVLVTGHFGNFEIAGFLAGLMGFPTYTIARPLDNPFLHEFLSQYRGATGQYIFPTKGSAADAERVLKSGGTLALLGDQYAGRKGCWVEFFGRRASCHKAVALFSLASDAPMAVVYAKRICGLYRFEVGMTDQYDPRDERPKVATVTDLTKWYNRELERVIRPAPDQYWWLHRRWKQPIPRRRKKRHRTDREAHAMTPFASGASSHARTGRARTE